MTYISTPNVAQNMEFLPIEFNLGFPEEGAMKNLPYYLGLKRIKLMRMCRKRNHSDKSPKCFLIPRKLRSQFGFECNESLREAFMSRARTPGT